MEPKRDTTPAVAAVSYYMLIIALAFLGFALFPRTT